MAKKRKYDNERFGRCMICLESIPVEYYFNKGDTIVCYECGTEYILTSKQPLKLSIAEGNFDPEDYYGDFMSD